MSENTIKQEELLEQANSAMSTVMIGGQAYSIGSRSVTRPPLKDLKAVKDDLEAQLAEAGSGDLLGKTFVAYFDGR